MLTNHGPPGTDELAAAPERPLEAALELAQLGHWEWDLVTNAVTWSDQTYRNLGYEPGEIDASIPNFVARIHHDDVERFLDVVGGDALSPRDYEFRVQLPNGTIRWARGHSRPVLDGDGSVIRMFGAVQDITAFRVAQQEASWYASLVASAEEVIIGTDRRGLIATWNDAAASFYGWAAEEVVGRPITMLREPAQRPQLEGVLERLRSGENVPAYEARHVTKDGRLVDVSVTASPIRDPSSGEVIGSSAIVRDISRAKRIQESLENAVAQERLMVDKLRDLDRIRTSFVSSISHELRTPLTSILGYLELLMDDPTGMNGHQVEMLDIVQRNSRRLLALIEDLLVLSRIESGAFKVLKEPVDVRSLVGAVVREVSPQAARADHQLGVSVADGVGAVLGDPAELERVLKGLLTNAIKFTPSGGHIEVRADRIEAGVSICVTDDGTGIPAQERERIFDPFFRSDQADRRAIPGTGLGLPIAKTIVEQHGGTITYDERPGGGSEFTILLPYAIEDRKAS